MAAVYHSVQRGVELYYSLLSADNGVTITSMRSTLSRSPTINTPHIIPVCVCVVDQLEGERWEPYVTTMMTSLRLPTMIKKYTITYAIVIHSTNACACYRLISRLLPDKRAAALVAYVLSYIHHTIMYALRVIYMLVL